MRISARSVVLFCGLLVPSLTVSAANWPSWRGSSGTGVADSSDRPPLQWGAEQGVRWKVPLPGPGNSSPIVYGDQVFITQFAPESRERLVLCFDRSTGKELWRHAEKAEQDEWTHPSNPLCAASPATDGKHVVAFLGQSGLVCLSLEGELIWKKTWGTPQHLFGGGASPIIVGGTCVVTFGPGIEQFYVGLDLVDGSEKWRVEMPRVDAPNPLEGPNAPPLPKETDLKDPFGSWATPLVVEADGRTELVISMPGELRAIDPQTGETLWHCDGPEPQVLCSPTFGNDRVVIQSGVALAVNPGGTGDVSDSHVRWMEENDPARIGSPLVIGDRIYGITMNGILDCRSLEDGSLIYRERLASSGGRGGSWASLVATGGRVYALLQSGTMHVIQAGDEYKSLAVNDLGEATNSTPAIAGDAIFIRTSGHLWCLSES